MDEFPESSKRAWRAGAPPEPEATAVEVPLALRQGRPENASRELPPADEPGESLIGRQIAHYLVSGVLGEGAMGVVYKAEDTRLRRTVALKFLSPDLTRDPTAKSRFLQEAQAASALDHANICTIYEVGETADGHLYLAMAHYDGETLKVRIGRGPLAVEEAAGIARQVAQGLAKAHRHGIVHRDIKPANLVVTSDGVVKILDFGVAKLRGGVEDQIGPFVGSPAYMSPEQVRRQEVEPSTDVWALGILLFEMLAGTRPFQPGEDPRSFFRSLLRDPPPSLVQLRPEVPPELERVVLKMLAKDPAERYPTAAEALADLAALDETAPAEAPAAPAATHRPRTAWIVAGAVLLAGAVAGGSYLSMQRGEPAGPVPVRVNKLTDLEGREMFPSLSPGGDSLVYAKSMDGDSDLYLQAVAGGDPVNLTAASATDDTMPAFSPDGRRIAFRSERDGGGIFVIPAFGGPARRVATFGYNPAWSPDGRALAVATEEMTDPSQKDVGSQIWRIDLATGQAKLLSREDGVQPSWSPNGRRIAYWGVPTGTGKRVLWTVPAEGGAPSAAVDDGALNWNPAWSPDGKYLYYSSNRSGSMNFWRVPIDETTGSVLGEPQPISTPSASSGFLSLSKDGTKFAYATNDSRANIEKLKLDPVGLTVSETRVPITHGSRIVGSCHVSPDGEWIVFHSSHPREDLYVVRSDGSGMRQLTRDDHKDRLPRWSPDGSRIAFYSNRSGRYEIWLVRPDGEGLEQLTHTSGPPTLNPVWSPDGRKIAFNMGGEAGWIDLGRPREIQRLPSARAVGYFYLYSWSGDGERLAGHTAGGIGVYSFRSRTYQDLRTRGGQPVWLQDGRALSQPALLHIGAHGELVLTDPASRKARGLASPPPNSRFNDVAVSADHNSLYAVRLIDEGDVWMASLEP